MNDEPKEGQPQSVLVADMSFDLSALFSFGDELRRIFRSPDSEDNPPAAQERVRLVLGLLRVAKFLDDAGVGHDVADHFASLAGYLDDLEKGVTHPVLAAPSLPGAPNDRLEVWMVRGQAVSGLECYLRSDLSIANAAKIIVKKYPDLSKLCQRGSNLDGSLKSWRKAFLSKEIKADSSTAFAAFSSNYPSMVARLESMTADDRRKLGDVLLTDATERARKLL